MSSNAPDTSIERYLEVLKVERKLSEHTLTAYGRDLASLATMATSLGRSIATLAVSDVRRAAAKLNAQGQSARSIARRLSAWRCYFAWRVLNGEMAMNPVIDVRAPKAGRRLPKALSVDDAVGLVANRAQGRLAVRDRAILELLYSSGLRLSEIVSLDWQYGVHDGKPSGSWLQLDEAEVIVTGKGRKQRRVPVGQFAMAALREWLSERSAWKGAEGPALFISERGTRLTGRSIELRVGRQAQAAGLSAAVHPHMLRHSFASHLLQSSGDIRAVQELLGHASLAATQVYTQLDFQRLASVYDAAHPRANRKQSVSSPASEPEALTVRTPEAIGPRKSQG